MGYTTDFKGKLTLSNPLTNEQFDYLVKLNETRRMKRDVNKLMNLFKGKDGYPGRTGTPEEIYGKDGEYFVGGLGFAGQENDDSVIDHNTSPGQLGYQFNDDFQKRWTENELRIENGECQPGLWCGWTITKDDVSQYLEWDGGEKFYHYIPWLKYLIKHFFSKWGVELNGEIEWSGEDFDDKGIIKVTNNKVMIGRTKFVFDDE
jgi:hypothetical protein